MWVVKRFSVDLKSDMEVSRCLAGKTYLRDVQPSLIHWSKTQQREGLVREIPGIYFQIWIMIGQR